MSRTKKSRKPGSAPTAKPKLSKQELANVEKRVRKKTGKQAGNRQQEATQSEQKKSSMNSGSSFGDFSNPIPKDIDELYSKTPNKVSEPEQEPSLRSIVGGRKSDIQLDSIFQLDNRYIVSVKDKELVIIDIKRAHERILYEGYLNAGRGGGSEVAQRLLFPEPIMISKADIDLLLGAADVLKLFGLDIAKSESGGLEVLAVPSGLAEKLQDCIDSVLEALQDGTWTDVEEREVC